MRSIYLDYNTTTPLAGAARQAMLPFLDDYFASPGNPHWQSRAVEEAIEDARAQVAALLSCAASEIVFTSGGTESCSLAILGVARTVERTQQRRIKNHGIISTFEHPAVRQAAEVLESRGWEITRIACDTEGVIDREAFANSIRKSTRFISLQLANGQTGVVQDVEKLAQIPRPKTCVFHTDATQAFSKMDIDLDRLDIDLMSISSHRMYGPKGIGALYVKNGVKVSSLFTDVTEESGIRPGLLSPMLIAGFGVAAQLVKASSSDGPERQLQLKNEFRSIVEAEAGRKVKWLGAVHQQLNNTLCMQLSCRSALELLARIGVLHIGIPIAYDSVAESSYARTALAALGLSLEQGRSVVTMSLGWNTTTDEVRDAAHLICEALI